MMEQEQGFNRVNHVGIVVSDAFYKVWEQYPKFKVHAGIGGAAYEEITANAKEAVAKIERK